MGHTLLGNLVDWLFGTPWASRILFLIVIIGILFERGYHKWKFYKRNRGDKAIPCEKGNQKDSVDADPPQEEPQQKQE